ncbi:hypothetical protein C8Q74DRAFT_1364942 [Fomes fomentarius]|nr:hypothetical protein C8Q74DRAFT_1364942 [Fomes fomentarius]
MWIKPKPVFNTTTTSLFDRASVPEDCPRAYPACDPGVGPGPALSPIIANDDDGADPGFPPQTTPVPTTAIATATVTGGTALVSPTAQSALASDIQHFGKRNFVGLLVLGLLALLGLALWLTFGAWPRRVMQRLRARAEREGGPAHAGKRDVLAAWDGLGSTRKGARRAHHLHTEGGHAHGSREPSEEGKIKPATSESSTASSLRVDESEIEGLGKCSGNIEERTSTLPRVRFA